MSRSQVKQALSSLIPTYNEDLPPELLELASSLLAQSKLRASTLKAEEDVARLYACANLACNRLKIELNLPKIEPNPPVPPRVYKRLYGHLEKVLPAPSTPGRANFGRAMGSRDPSKSPSARTRHSKATPTKEAALAPFRGTPKGKVNTPSRLSHVTTPATHKTSAALPPWLRPTLRYLCKELDSMRIAPTIIAGMESIVIPLGKRTEEEWVHSHLTWLLGALYLFVWKSVNMPEDIDEDRYVKVRKDIVETLRNARRTLKVKDLDEEETWEGWRELGVKDLDAALNRINKQGWLESDWAEDIDDLITAIEEDRPEAAGSGDALNDPNDQPRIRKADIMFQERYDHLSEKKQREYLNWKEGIMMRIAELERRCQDPMEVDN